MTLSEVGHSLSFVTGLVASNGMPNFTKRGIGRSIPAAHTEGVVEPNVGVNLGL